MGSKEPMSGGRLPGPGRLGSHLGWVAIAVLLGASPAAAGNNSIGLEIANDRDPDDFGEPKDMKYLINGAHTFDNGVILGGSFQYTDPTHGGSDSQNLEGTGGYRVPFGHVFSVVGSAGIGARFVGSDDAFAYYVLRIGADLRLTDRITWNAIGYRYRNAFDTENDCNMLKAAGTTYVKGR